jgi:uncharacterized membrane protein YphA (DoxX/SURF4 family)
MSLSAKLRRAPLRAATGAFILNSGVSKLSSDDDTAKQLHGTATNSYPFLGNLQPKMFARGLAVGEIAVGAAVLLPVVPPLVAGAALAGFSGALLNLYWRTPGMHREGSPLPTAQGTPLAKDVWMFAIGLGLMTDAALEPAHDKVIELEAAVAQKRSAKSRRARRKAARKLALGTEYLHQARGAAAEWQGEVAKRADRAVGKAHKGADRAAGKARKSAERAVGKAEKGADRAAAEAHLRAEKVSAAAAKALAEAAARGRVARDVAMQAAEEYGPVAAEKVKSAGQAALHWAEEYGPVAAEKARAAREAAEEYGVKARERFAS